MRSAPIPPPPRPGTSAAATELRQAVLLARQRLREVLHERTRAQQGLTSWSGPHRTRFDEDTADLLAAGRALDAALTARLATLDVEHPWRW